MESEIWTYLESIAQHPSFTLYCLLALAACLEYVFPPFPGDTVTLFAGFLVGVNEEWSFALVFLALNVGSVLGTLIDYAAGVWLAPLPCGEQILGGTHQWRTSDPLSS